MLDDLMNAVAAKELEGEEEIDRDQAEAALHNALGPVINAALRSPDVTDVRRRVDTAIMVKRFGVWRKEGTLSDSKARKVLKLAAYFADRIIRRDMARLDAILPHTKARLKGHLPPLTEGPIFTLRRPSTKLFTPADYIEAGVCDLATMKAIEGLCRKRVTVLVAGAPGAGKSTLVNTMLHMEGFVDGHNVAVEDTPELVLPEDSDRLITDPFAPDPVTMRVLVMDALRMAPDAIHIGEARGPEALEIVIAWNTGIPGIATLHANNARDTLVRLGQLIAMNAGIVPSRAEIARACKSVIFLKNYNGIPRIEEVIEVDWNDKTESVEIRSLM